MNDFSSAWSLLRWAREDIANLSLATKTFVNGDLYTVFAEDDPDTGDMFLKVRMASVPDEISKLASHALWDIKHALDHATCAAVRVIMGNDIEDIHFPVASHPNDLESRLKTTLKDKTTLKYPSELHGLFRSFEPYPASDKFPGGGNEFVALNKLANTTKHSVALGTCAKPHFAGASGTGGIKRIYPDWWDSAKQELTIGLMAKDSKVKMHIDLACFVSFSEVDVLRPYPANDVLTGYATCVEDIVSKLEAAVS